MLVGYAKGGRSGPRTTGFREGRSRGVSDPCGSWSSLDQGTVSPAYSTDRCRNRAGTGCRRTASGNGGKYALFLSSRAAAARDRPSLSVYLRSIRGSSDWLTKPHTGLCARPEDGRRLAAGQPSPRDNNASRAGRPVRESRPGTRSRFRTAGSTFAPTAGLGALGWSAVAAEDAIGKLEDWGYPRLWRTSHNGRLRRLHNQRRFNEVWCPRSPDPDN